MNVFAKFDEIPSMSLQDIKETKRYGHTVKLLREITPIELAPSPVFFIVVSALNI